MAPPAAALTAFQITVAKLFFSLPQSDGFLLAGGAALAAQDLTSRPTRDLDLFTRAGGPSVPHARDAFEEAVLGKGWTVRRIRDSETFCRLLVTGDEELLVDLAVDSPPNSPPSASAVGPTFGREETCRPEGDRPLRPGGSARFRGCVCPRSTLRHRALAAARRGDRWWIRPWRVRLDAGITRPIHRLRHPCGVRLGH